jgi:hypothetical protein
MVASVSTGKGGGLDYLENGEDKNRLLSNGEVITRDMLDTRVTLQGDIRATEHILESMKPDNYSKDYYHITHSFKENISIEEMQEIAHESEAFYLAGYNEEEYNIYTEYHIPKESAQYKLLTAIDGDKKYYDLLSEQEANQFLKEHPLHGDKLEKRYPHTHTIIARKNLLTNTQLKITEKNEVDAINSFQEYINIKYGLESPKENKRDITNQQYKADRFDENNIELKSNDFKNLTNTQTKKLLDTDIRNQIIQGNINNYDEMVQYLQNQDFIISLKEIQTKNNQYIKIQIKGQEKAVNLRAEIFTKEFYEDIKINFDEKVRTVEGKSMSEYKQEVDTYKQRRYEEVSKRYDKARETSLKTTLIEKALKEKFESKTNNTNENKIINDLDQGKAVFLTGGAGVGKSYTTNNIVKHYENKGLTVVKLGSTGIAATNINGQTLHSFLELGIKKNITELKEFDKHNIERIDKLNNKLQNTDMIIIDEISMVSDRQMEMIKYRLDNAHYQGKLMVVGDFNQLPPVSKDEKVGYAFESKAWKDLQTQTHELTVIKRSDNKEFAQTLNRLRYGHISKEDNQMLLNMQNNTINENKATYIYSTNKAVHEHNKKELDKLDTESENYKTTIQSEHELTNEQKDKILEETPLYKNLEIKTGAPVLITANDKELGVANGDKGIYLGLNNQNQMRVKLDRNDKIVSLSPKEFKTQIEDDDKTISATATNYPIRPAYAITTHKSQGMSIDHLAIDPNKQFERNQFYVALSRALNPNNVKILPLDKKYKNDFQNIIKQDNKVLDFYHPTLRSKELKEFDAQVQDRQNERRENWFKEQETKKNEAKHQSKEQEKSNPLNIPNLSSFITQNKQVRQLKEFTKNKMQEVKDGFKKLQADIKQSKSMEAINKLNQAIQHQKENYQKIPQVESIEKSTKQLQKEKG